MRWSEGSYLCTCAWQLEALMTGTLYNRSHPAPRGRVLTDALGKPFNCFYTEDKTFSR